MIRALAEPRRRAWRVASLAACAGMALLLLAGCSSRPPARPNSLCEIFAEKPSWHRAAHAAQRRWGTPVPVIMAFVHRESSFQANAKPPRGRLLWVIPWRRPSSAYGYAQATNETWADYLADRGGWFRNRNDFADAVDFIGWYNYHSTRELRLRKDDAYHLYLAYYNGRGGYRSGRWKRSAKIKGYADIVARRAASYREQHARCAKPPRRFF